MGINRTLRALTAWIASFAVLLVALAPSLSYALTSQSGTLSEWIEICTSSGIKRVEVELTAEQAIESLLIAKHDQHFEDCPFCRTQGDTFGPAPASMVVMPSAQASSLQPTLFYQAPRPLFIWTPAQSRAPPTYS